MSHTRPKMSLRAKAAGPARCDRFMKSSLTILFCNIARRLCLSCLFTGDVIGQANLIL